MNKDWVVRIEENINTQKENIHKRDVRFFQVDQLNRIAVRLESFENECAECKKHKTALEDISKSLAQYINTNAAEKREFEKKTDAIKKHLKEAHQIFPVYYFVSYYSFVGIAAGIVLGLLVGYVFSEIFLQSIVIFLIAGLLTGYYLGNKKDWAVRRGKRLL
ncbi:MAG: hypothetical protein U9R19_18590 [Bacteroidota bacterium]|nr:hypothetical protein [Bacteroidota bacterium]